MSTLLSSRYPTPESWEEFEKMILDFAKIRWQHTDFQQYGRQGQEQHGVDTYSMIGEEHIGIQAKNTGKKLTIKIVNDEIKKAQKFRPNLSKYYIATTVSNDTELQDHVNQLNAEKSEAFKVHLIFWNDIINELKKDTDILYRYYPDYKPQQEPAKIKHDKELLDNLQKNFPYQPCIKFLKEHNFSNLFHQEHIDPIHTLIYDWESADKKFLNINIQKEFTHLISKGNELAYLLAQNSFLTHHNNGWFTTNPNNEDPCPDYIIETINKINSSATEFVRIYESFIHNSKNKLYENEN